MLFVMILWVMYSQNCNINKHRSRKCSNTLSHPENDRDIIEHAKSCVRDDKRLPPEIHADVTVVLEMRQCIGRLVKTNFCLSRYCMGI